MPQSPEMQLYHCCVCLWEGGFQFSVWSMKLKLCCCLLCFYNMMPRVCCVFSFSLAATWATKVVRYKCRNAKMVFRRVCGGIQTFPGLIFTACRMISGAYHTWRVIWVLTQGKNNQFSFRKMMHLTFSHYSPSLAFQQSSGITFSQLHSSQVSMLVRGGFHLLEERAWLWSWAVSQGRKSLQMCWMDVLHPKTIHNMQVMYLAGVGKATILTWTPSPACAATVWPWETKISTERWISSNIFMLAIEVHPLVFDAWRFFQIWGWEVFNKSRDLSLQGNAGSVFPLLQSLDGTITRFSFPILGKVIFPIHFHLFFDHVNCEIHIHSD